jgi:hypothetical protein
MNEETQEPAKKPARKSTRKTAKEPGKEPGKETSANKRKVWLRGLYMLFMLLALHLGGTLLAAVTLIQFIVVLMNGTPNKQLVAFGRSLGNYLRQIAHFLTYSTEDVPFPFSDWPSDE